MTNAMAVGALGHWESECPKKKSKSKNSNKNNSKFRPKKVNSGKENPKKSNSKHPPPKAGESEIKMINGKKTYWGSKCNRWTLSHGTESHKTKEELAKLSTPSANKVSFDLVARGYFDSLASDQPCPCGLCWWSGGRGSISTMAIRLLELYH